MGTVKKLQFAEGTDVGAPTDLGIASSTVTIQPYVDDAAYVTANGAAASGDVYLNTSLDFFRYYTNGAWRNALAAQDQSDPTKTFRVDYAGQGTGRKTTLAVVATTTDKVITLPDLTDTLIGRITADQGASRVLNKDFDDATTFIVDSSDTTKKIGFNAGGSTGTKTTFAAAQTADRVITAPDATGTIVLNDNTVTLSNKTLASPLVSGGSLDMTAAGTFSLLASAGANNITIGGATSTVVIAGDLLVQGTTTTLNTATLDVEDFNITVNNGGNDASSEGAGLTVERTGTSGSMIYSVAATSRWKFGDLGAEIEGVTLSHTQALSNKAHTLSSWSGGTITLADIDGSTASNASRITVPSGATAALNALTRKAGTLVYDTTLGVFKGDNGVSLSSFATAGVASPTAQGTVTSYFPTIQSAVSTTTNADLTATTTDGFSVYLFSTGNTDRTLNLPSASTDTGRILTVKKTDSGTGTVTIAGTIDGATFQKITAEKSYITLCSNGTEWKVIGVFDIVEATVTAGTTALTGGFADVPGASLALTAGSWELLPSVSCAWYAGSSTAVGFDVFQITDSGNTLIAGTAREMGGGGNSGENDRVMGTYAVSKVVTITAGEIYKVRGKVVQDTGSSSGEILNGTDKTSTFYARRVG